MGKWGSGDWGELGRLGDWRELGRLGGIGEIGGDWRLGVGVGAREEDIDFLDYEGLIREIL